ncbi:hypothetical protein DFJ63DRAFT_282033 [Scheffersomyces coipomensis]|uniref:uncharacterized protein n=1 Tax=Scheffersomyces coipomensis TaxID=1788519 RepID=UPI00315CE010
MSYYDPYQGMGQQYIGQPYYPQYYQQQSQQQQQQQSQPQSHTPDDQLMANLGGSVQASSIDSRPSSYDYPQYANGLPQQISNNIHGSVPGAPIPDSSNAFGFDTSNGNGGNEFYNEDGVFITNNGSGASNLINPLSNGQYNGGDINQLQYNNNNNNNPSYSGPGSINGGLQAGIGANGSTTGSQQGNISAAPSRTVYLGNIPNDIQPNELLDYVRSGILESVKILPAKNCAFISFIDHQSALLFHSDCILKKLNIKGHDIRIGWGKNSPILPAVLEAIQRDGATRNVYLGNLNNPVTGEVITEPELREDLSCYGIIDCIKIIPEKGIAFIHFLSILSAIRCVANLPLKEKYLDKKCFYGKDRCAFITKTQQHNAAQYLGLAPGMEHIVTAADREFISSALVQQSAAAAQIATQAGGANNLGNRTVYLGNLHQDSSVEEICNVVRGGLLQSIRFLKERHVCFITFIDPIAAAQFFAMCQLHGLTIHNRRIKVGWGKHSGPLSNALSLAVSNGASRNIYIGNIIDFEYYNPQKLRDDFTKFGDIEQINYLEEKNCAFINFVNIGNAIKAIDGIKSFEDYKNLKINFGKDRCGNLPRQFQNQNQNNNNNHQQHQQQQPQGLLNGLDNGSNQSFSDNDFGGEDPNVGGVIGDEI